MLRGYVAVVRLERSGKEGEKFKEMEEEREELERLVVRTDPLGSDRWGNKYWAFRADKGKLFIEMGKKQLTVTKSLLPEPSVALEVRAPKTKEEKPKGKEERPKKVKAPSAEGEKPRKSKAKPESTVDKENTVKQEDAEAKAVIHSPTPVPVPQPQFFAPWNGPCMRVVPPPPRPAGIASIQSYFPPISESILSVLRDPSPRLTPTPMIPLVSTTVTEDYPNYLPSTDISWSFFDTIASVRGLYEALDERGIRESILKTTLGREYQGINKSEKDEATEEEETEWDTTGTEYMWKRVRRAFSEESVRRTRKQINQESSVLFMEGTICGWLPAEKNEGIHQ